MGTTKASGDNGIHDFSFNAATRLLGSIFFLVAMMADRGASAAEWSFDPTLEFSQIYSDNINLAPDGVEMDEFITEISPGLLVHGEGRRVVADFGYRMQNLIFANDGDVETNNQLTFSGTGELLSDRFFLDAAANVSQQNTSNIGSTGADNISQTGNREDVITYSISPYWTQRFGNIAEGLARFTYDDVDTEDDAASSSSWGISTELNSGDWFQRYQWGISYDRRDVNDDDSAATGTGDSGNTDTERVQGRIRYVLDRRFSLLGSGGYENNDFASVEDTDGVTWSVGFAWTPSRNTQLEATYGERFFGDTWSLDFQHRSRRTTWLANYSEEVSLTRDLLLQRGDLALEGIQQSIVDPETDEEVSDLIAGGLPTLTDEVFIRKHFIGGVDVAIPRGQVGLRGFNTRREFQATGDEENTVGASVFFTRELTRNTSGFISTEWSQTDIRASDREDNLVGFGLGLSYRFGQRMSGALDYRFFDRSSDIEASEFTENRITARLIFTL